MTTNVFDGRVGSIATDSRWSVQRGRWLLYLDDTNFDKVEIFKTTAFMFAGKGRLIEQWKLWIRSEPADDSGQPPVEGISINGIDMETSAIRYAEGKSITHESSIFAGSGALHAVRCWAANRDARRSVETAKQFDPATGGEVKYVDFKTKQHNLGSNIFAPSTIDDIDRAVATRGSIMDIGTLKTGAIPFKLSELAANNAEIKQIQADIAAGKLSAEAPCEAMYSEWTPEEKGKLKAFLGDVFGWKK